MGFNQYQTVPEEIRNKLNFIDKSYYYIFRNSAGTLLRGVLFELTRESYNKAFVRLTGGEGSIVKGDKVFLLPNCKIPMFKIKDYLKSIEASLTDDVSKATKIIGHDRCREGVIGQAANSSILTHMDNMWYASQWRPSDYHDSKEVKEEIMKKMLDEFKTISQEDLECVDAIISRRAFNISVPVIHWYEVPSDRDFKQSTVSKRFITPTGVLILYYHISKKIPIINEDNVADSIEKPVVIEKAQYDSIKNLLKSDDSENVKVGVFLLCNSDPVKSFYYVQQLAKEFRWKLNDYSGYKNVRLFQDLSDWDTITNWSAEQCINFMIEKGIMKQEFFDSYIAEAHKQYVDKFESDVFRIIVEPNSRFVEFANDTHRFTVTKDKVQPDDSEVEIIQEEEEDD